MNEGQTTIPLCAVSRRVAGLSAVKNLVMPRASYQNNLPSVICAVRDGKEKRDSLHRLVHEFRACHGFRDSGRGRGHERYQLCVSYYLRKRPHPSEAKAIEKLSSLLGYRNVRQVGRMRISCEQLTAPILKLLCREVKAALVWSSLRLLDDDLGVTGNY